MNIVIEDMNLKECNEKLIKILEKFNLMDIHIE